MQETCKLDRLRQNPMQVQVVLVQLTFKQT